MLAINKVISSVDRICCPSCKSHSVFNIGAIPPSPIFGGQVMQIPIPGGDLYRCELCHLQFRFPKLSKQVLDESYNQTVDERWASRFDERIDWKIAADWIKKNGKSKRVLDIGCNDGVFLTGLGQKHTVYGVEFNAAAANRAQRKGVKIIGSDLQKDIKDIAAMFDVITAFDVIEHVDDPLHFLQLLADKLTPGGEVIVSTGNTQSWSWKLMGSRYWYCVYPEHITFISPLWARKAAQKLALTIIDEKAFAHVEGSILRNGKEAFKNLVYKFMPSLAGWLRTKGFGKADAGNHPELMGHPPGWLTAKDHIIFRFRK